MCLRHILNSITSVVLSVIDDLRSIISDKESCLVEIVSFDRAVSPRCLFIMTFCGVGWRYSLYVGVLRGVVECEAICIHFIQDGLSLVAIIGLSIYQVVECLKGKASSLKLRLVWCIGITTKLVRCRLNEVGNIVSTTACSDYGYVWISPADGLVMMTRPLM